MVSLILKISPPSFTFSDGEGSGKGTLKLPVFKADGDHCYELLSLTHKGLAQGPGGEVVPGKL